MKEIFNSYKIHEYVVESHILCKKKLNQTHILFPHYAFECWGVGLMDTPTMTDLQCLARSIPNENISSTAFQNAKVYKFLLQ